MIINILSNFIRSIKVFLKVRKIFKKLDIKIKDIKIAKSSDSIIIYNLMTIIAYIKVIDDDIILNIRETKPNFDITIISMPIILDDTTKMTNIISKFLFNEKDEITKENIVSILSNQDNEIKSE